MSLLVTPEDQARALQAEMDDLRSTLLPRYVGALGAGLVVWLYWACAQAGTTQLAHLLSVAVISACTWLAMAARERSYQLAATALVLGLCSSVGLATWAYADATVLALGTAVLVVTNSLLGLRGTIAAAALQLALALLALGAGRWPELNLHIATYGCVVGALAVAKGPWEDTVSQALEGWQRFRDALGETRIRRGQLRRTLEALEEATYRIERMNNELILARQQADIARANKARFAATVSHELRGPLNLILGFSRLMALSPERYGVALPAPYREDLDAIHQSSEHIVSLLDDVLDLSQIEVDQMPLIKRRVDLLAIINDAVEVVRPLTQRKELYLRVEAPSEPQAVLVDPVRLRQVLLNLLTNAVRFTSSGGIRVTVAPTGDELIISVVDTGRGIPQEQLPKLFSEFAQLHRADEESVTKGSGLGLAISKQLVELHGGRVWAESEEGIGTKVCVSLPRLGRGSASVAIAQRGAPIQQPGAFDVCLVVHRDPEMIRLLARQMPEYRMVGVPTIDDLQPLIDEYHPRAIVTLPELADAVDSVIGPLGFDIPVVPCSMPEMGRRAQMEGALTYLMKPITEEMLRRVLATVHGSANPLDVLIVDDDPDAVRLIQALLEALDHACACRTAYNGEQALQRMREKTPGLLLLDLVMPVLDGEATLARMREDEQLRDVPVAVISAQDIVGGTLSFGTEIGVRSQRPVGLAQGIRRLRALLDIVTPSYLPERGNGLSSHAVPASQPAW